jgi:hypothetical protein
LDRPRRRRFFFFRYRGGAFWGTHVMLVVSRLGCVVVVFAVVRMAVGVFRMHSATSDQAVPQFNCNVFVNGAGMRFLFLHTQFRQQIENDARLHFKLSRQLVDPNFLHRRDC